MDNQEKSQNQLLPSLNGLRALSILLVIGSHFRLSQNYENELGSWGKYIFDGGIGVNIFFVISGFLITYLLTKEEGVHGRISLKKFYFRRILRIFPIYYLFISTLILLDYLTQLEVPTINYISSILYLKNYFGGSWIDGHLWSLAVEEQFYFIWPIVFFLTVNKKKSRYIYSVLLIFAAPFFRVIFYHYHHPLLLNFSFLVHMDSLMIGSMGGYVFYLFKTQKNIPRFLKFVIQFVGDLKINILILGVFIIIYGIHFLRINFMLGPLTVSIGTSIQSTATVILIIRLIEIKSGMTFWFFNNKVIDKIGILSYSIYIWQQLFFNPEHTYSRDHLYFLDIPYNVLLIFVVSWISYHIFEKPFLRLKTRFSVK